MPQEIVACALHRVVRIVPKKGSLALGVHGASEVVISVFLGRSLFKFASEVVRSVFLGRSLFKFAS